jgi:hypothetical protein
MFFFYVIPVRYHTKKRKIKEGDALKNRTPTGMVTPLFKMGPKQLRKICWVTMPAKPARLKDSSRALHVTKNPSKRKLYLYDISFRLRIPLQRQKNMFNDVFPLCLQFFL